MSQIGIRNVVKNFKDVEVLKNISLDIEDGSFTVLLGPSGCGKSTLLRIISGLESPTGGDVFIGGENVTKVEPRDRNVAMVFQNYALYPHLTVYQNIEYGLKARKVKKEERRELIRQAVEMVRLEDQVSKRPAEMSGGQRQRVSLARAIVKRPNVFLMDEPLSNLDAKLRGQMRVELLGLYNRLQTTFLYVTHDQVEAMSMGTKIVILDQGKVQQIGTPKEIYEDPTNIFVAGFIGSPPANIIDLGKYQFAIRPEHILLGAPEKDPEDYIALNGQVMSMENLGHETIFNVHTEIGDLHAKGQNTWADHYTTVRLYIQAKKMLHFDAQGQRVTDTSRCNDAMQYFNQYIAANNSACAADKRYQKISSNITVSQN
jgi:sn-glycerol 3-phosphate transport system ATP-binding protein